MSSFFSLGAELASEQDRVLGDQRVHELDLLQDKNHSRHRLVSRRRRIAFLLVGLLVAITTTISAMAFRFPVVRYWVDGALVTPAKHGAFGRWFMASASEPNIVRFSDGSLAKPTKGSRMRVVGTNRRGASLVLESGSLELQVAGSQLTEYLVGAGPFAVAIARGRAEVSWDSMSNSLDLVVYEGNLVISGCQFGAGESVASGQKLGAHCSVK